MKVKIDGELCTGHGRCFAVARRVYKLDDNGYNVQRGQVIEIPPGLEVAARLGVDRCPERAIAVIEE